MNGLGTTFRPVADLPAAAAGTAPRAPASTAASPDEKSAPTIRGFIVPTPFNSLGEAGRPRLREQ